MPTASEDPPQNNLKPGESMTVSGLPYVEPTLLAEEITYPLTRHDFEKLEGPHSSYSAISGGVFAAGVGSLVPAIGKFLQSKFSEKPISIETWEWWGPVAVAALAGLVYLVGWMTSEKRKLRSKIIAKFESRPRTHRQSA